MTVGLSNPRMKMTGVEMGWGLGEIKIGMVGMDVIFADIVGDGESVCRHAVL